MLRREHQFRANLGRIYSFTRGLRMDDNGDFRRPDVLACEAYARQTLDSIVRGPDDPFHYRLQELWLDVFQRPWDQPTDLDELLADLAEKVGNGELKVYLEYDPNWEALGPMGTGGKNTSAASSESTDGERDVERTQDVEYTPHSEVEAPKAGGRIFKREHPDGNHEKEDPYTLQADGKPLGAEEGVMPAEYSGMKKPPKNHDELKKEGWPDLTYGGNKTYATFTEAKPVELEEGTKIYRVVDEKANDAGGFWFHEMPDSKTSWRSGSAVKDSWNDNGYFVEHTVGKDGLKAWEGPAAGQQYEKSQGKEFYLSGGKTQLFITPGDTEPSAPKLTEWPEP